VTGCGVWGTDRSLYALEEGHFFEGLFELTQNVRDSVDSS